MGDFCYSVLESKANWNDGRLTCQQMGADLASVNDRAENNFVFSLIVGGTGKQRSLNSIFLWKGFKGCDTSCKETFVFYEAGLVAGRNI